MQHWITVEGSLVQPSCGALWLGPSECDGGYLWAIVVGHGGPERAGVAAGLTTRALLDRYSDLLDEHGDPLSAVNAALDEAHSQLRSVGNVYARLAGLAASVGVVALHRGDISAATLGAVSVVLSDGAIARQVARDHVVQGAPERAVGLPAHHVEPTVTPISDEETVVLLTRAAADTLSLDTIAAVLERVSVRDATEVLVEAAARRGLAGQAAAIARSAPLPPLLSSRARALEWVLSGQATWSDETMLLQAARAEREPPMRTNFTKIPEIGGGPADDMPKIERTVGLTATEIQAIRAAAGIEDTPPPARQGDPTPTPAVPEAPVPVPARDEVGLRTERFAKPLVDGPLNKTVQLSIAALQRTDEAGAAAPKTALPDWPTMAGIPAIGYVAGAPPQAPPPREPLSAAHAPAGAASAGEATGAVAHAPPLGVPPPTVTSSPAPPTSDLPPSEATQVFVAPPPPTADVALVSLGLASTVGLPAEVVAAARAEADRRSSESRPEAATVTPAGRVSAGPTSPTPGGGMKTLALSFDTVQEQSVQHATSPTPAKPGTQQLGVDSLARVPVQPEDGGDARRVAPVSAAAPLAGPSGTLLVSPEVVAAARAEAERSAAESGTLVDVPAGRPAGSGGPIVAPAPTADYQPVSGRRASTAEDDVRTAQRGALHLEEPRGGSGSALWIAAAVVATLFATVAVWWALR